MCRFLMVKSKNKIKPEKLLIQFADMCRNCRAPDGDWQGDGWGITFQNQKSKIKDKKWETHKSLKPIWEDKDKFQEFAETDIFVVHARSAGFPQHKGNIEFNQPFISDGLCFVFNGMIKGVKIEIPLPGEIGAQKIFSLIQKTIRDEVAPDETLKKVDQLIIGNSQNVIGMNIGLAVGDKIYVLCEYNDNREYFGVRYHADNNIDIVCSQPIGDYKWNIMNKGDGLVL